MIHFGQQGINCAVTAFTAAPKHIKIIFLLEPSCWAKKLNNEDMYTPPTKSELREQRFIPVFIYVSLYGGAQLSIRTSLLLPFTVTLQTHECEPSEDYNKVRYDKYI